jgi:predicted Zn finger-like uncharacterized protein
MLTRCPACGTTFRINAGQLRQRSGRVRCGQCQQAFSALEQLLEEPTPGAPVARAPLPDVTDTRDDVIDASPTTIDAVPPAPTFSPAAVEMPASAALSVATTGASPTALDAQPLPDVAPTPAQSVVIETPPAPIAATTAKAPADPLLDGFSDWPEDEATAAPIRRWPWLLGSLVLLTALLIQAAIAFRVELAVLWPPAKPGLLALCRMAGCTVGLPARGELIGIEASDLHPDPNQPGRLSLSATIANRAPFNQEFPHLELTLTDVADKPVARKVFPPASYLPPAIDRAAGMPASGEVAVNLVLDIGELSANGYRLYLFYP